MTDTDLSYSKPIYGSAGANSWQQWQSTSEHQKSAPSLASTSALRALPSFPMKRGEKETFEAEREREAHARREAGHAPLNSGYTTFLKRGADGGDADVRGDSAVAAAATTKLLTKRVDDDSVVKQSEAAATTSMPLFIPSSTYEGSKSSFIFTTRDALTGYYHDASTSSTASIPLPDSTPAPAPAKKVKTAKNVVRATLGVPPGPSSSSPLPLTSAAASSSSNPPASDVDEADRIELERHGWSIGVSTSGETYYYNKLNETSWSHPLRKNAKPEGLWKEAKTPLGETYYFHTLTNETSWEKPA